MVLDAVASAPKKRPIHPKCSPASLIGIEMTDRPSPLPIAEAIGKGLGLSVISIPINEAGEHFGWMGRFFGADATASNTITRELLNWEPTHQGLLEDLNEGHYFRELPH